MRMRKAFMVLGTLMVLMLAFALSAVADSSTESKSIEVLFDSNTKFTEAEQDTIRAHFINEGNDVQPCGLKCTLFGHDYKTELVTVITHKARSTSPRCLKETFETKICTVCSDTVSTLVNEKLIVCCD